LINSAEAGWINIKKDFPDSLAIDPTNSQILYYVASIPYKGTSLFKSKDGGKSWKLINTKGLSSSSSIFYIYIDPLNVKTFYAICSEGNYAYALYKSTDTGITWQNIYSDPNNIAIFAIDKLNDKILFVGGGFNLLKSVNGGKSWKEISTYGIYLTDIIINPKNTNIIYVTDNDYTLGLWKTSNGGKTWAQLVNGLPNYGDARVGAIVADPVNINIIYIYVHSVSSKENYDGLYKSVNGGVSWIKIASNLDWGYVTLVIDPINTHTIYAGTDNGVYKSTNTGTTWHQMNTGLTDVDIFHVFGIDPQNPQILYAGTYNKGLFKYIPGSSHLDLLLLDGQ